MLAIIYRHKNQSVQKFAFVSKAQGSFLAKISGIPPDYWGLFAGAEGIEILRLLG